MKLAEEGGRCGDGSAQRGNRGLDGEHDVCSVPFSFQSRNWATPQGDNKNLFVAKFDSQLMLLFLLLLTVIQSS